MLIRVAKFALAASAILGLAVRPVLAATHKTSSKSSSAAKAATAPTAPPLPVFTFKGLTAGQSLPDGVVEPCTPGSLAPKGELECDFVERDLAGVKPIYADMNGSFFHATTYNGKLSGIGFTAESDNYPTVVAALISRYGNPCNTSTEKWESKAGASFDNAVTTWCFSTGKLVAKSMSFQRDYMEVTYRDNVNHAPQEQPKVNF